MIKKAIVIKIIYQVIQQRNLNLKKVLLTHLKRYLARDAVRSKTRQKQKIKSNIRLVLLQLTKVQYLL